jgi:hypothetical protein
MNMILNIELIGDDAVLIIASDEATAKRCLKRNPFAEVSRGADDEWGLVYSLDQTNLINAIKRH